MVGISGKKLSFASLPYKFINGFAVESAGMLSHTVKATLFMSKLEKGREIEFGKKDVDIFQINNLLASKILSQPTHNWNFFCWNIPFCSYKKQHTHSGLLAYKDITHLLCTSIDLKIVIELLLESEIWICDCTWASDGLQSFRHTQSCHWDDISGRYGHWTGNACKAVKQKGAQFMWLEYCNEQQIISLAQ